MNTLGAAIAALGLPTLLGSVVTLMVTAIWRGWVIPRSTVDRLAAQQQQIIDLHKEAALLERQRSDLAQGDLMKLMAELTEALRRSKPAGT